MRIGVVFPQTEIGPDRGRRPRLRRAASRISATAHPRLRPCASAPTPTVHRPWNGPYDLDTHLPRAVRPLRLPGRAHLPRTRHRDHHPPPAPDRAGGQAGGRGRPAHRRSVPPRRRLGWNAVEYEALGKDFTNRGRRIDEQVELLRRLWTERASPSPAVRAVHGAGFAPLPVQRPIPVWFGAESTPAWRRMADWPTAGSRWSSPETDLDGRGSSSRAARPRRAAIRATIGMEGRVNVGEGDADDARRPERLAAGRGDAPVGQHDGRRAGHRRRPPGGPGHGGAATSAGLIAARRRSGVRGSRCGNDEGGGADAPPPSSTYLYCPGSAVAGSRRGVVGAVVGQRRGVGVEELAVVDGEVPPRSRRGRCRSRPRRRRPGH